MAQQLPATTTTVPGMPVDSLKDGQEYTKSQKCAECGSFLTVCWGGKWGHSGYLVRCAKNEAHQGFVEALGLTQARRRGEDLPVYVERAIDRKSLSQMDMERAVSLAQSRFPAAEMTPEQAAFFLWECLRKGLDPFLGEIVPVPFGKDRSRRTVASIITEDGALSQAARGCPDTYAGPPSTRPLLGEELKLMAEALGLPEGTKYLWEAKGKRRDGEEFKSWGWMTPDDVAKAQGDAPGKATPAARAPGNQARVRAIKRWVKEAFPEAASKLKEFYEEQLRVADETGGPAAVQALAQIIDADFIELPAMAQSPMPAAVTPSAREATAKIAPPPEPAPASAGSPAAPSAIPAMKDFAAVMVWVKTRYKGKYDASDVWPAVDSENSMACPLTPDQLAEKLVEVWG